VHRVGEHVQGRVLEVLVVADHRRVEALLEEMADALVPFIESLRVDAVEAVHTARDVLELGLDDQVEVIVEQAVGDDGPAEACGRVGEETHPAQAVDVVDDDRHPRDAADSDVEGAGGRKNATRQARHGRHRTVLTRILGTLAATFYRHVTGTVP
jgi:hypothetical protein